MLADGSGNAASPRTSGCGQIGGSEADSLLALQERVGVGTLQVHADNNVPGDVSDNPVHYMRVRDSVRAWEAIGAGPVLLRWIRYGYRLPFTKFVSPFFYESSPPSTGDELTALRDIKRRLFEVGAVQRSSNRSFVSRSRLEPKKSGGFRLVVDLRHLNAHLKQYTCKYETLDSLQFIIEIDDWLLSADLQDGYYHLGIHPSDRKFITTMLDGELVEFCVLPFGLQTAPYVFTKLMRPMVRALRARGLRVAPYLDDFLFMARTFTQSIQLRDIADRLFSSLGLRRNAKKCQWEPTHELVHLGIGIDTKRGLFLIPPTKLQTLSAAASSLLRYASSHRRWVSAKRLSKVCGLASSLRLAFPMAATVTRSLHDALATKADWHSDCRLDKQAIRDLQFLVDLPLEQCSKAIFKPSPTITMHTDASDIAWGAVFNELVPARAFFDDRESALHITAKELLAVLNGLESFDQQIDHKAVIRLVTDNMAVRGVLNKGSSASAMLMSIYRRIVHLCMRKGVLIQAEYIPSEENTFADLLSRFYSLAEWALSSDFFRDHHLIFDSGAVVDRFATRQNRVVPRFNSFFPEPGSEGDAFNVSWEGDLNWINPPLGLLPRVVNKLSQEKRARAVMLAPYWPSAVWFPRLLRLASGHVQLIDDFAKYVVSFAQDARQAEVLKNPRWKFMLVYIDDRSPDRGLSHQIHHSLRPIATKLGLLPDVDPFSWLKNQPAERNFAFQHLRC